MSKKIIFGNSKSNFLVVSPKNFRIGIKNLEYVNYTSNFKKELEKSTFQGLPFLEHFSFNDISVWWFFHERFFYQIQPYINFIILFEKFLEKQKPEIIEINDYFEYFILIQQICKKHGILFQYNTLKLQKFSLQKKFKKNIRNIIRKYRLSKLTKNRIKNHLSQFSKKYKNTPSIEQKIIFATSVTYRRPIFNLKTNLFERGEYLTKPFMDFLDDDKSFLGISLPYTTSHSFDKIYQERLKDDMIWIPEEFFLKNTPSITMFLKKYHNLINNNKFQKLFSFCGIDFWDLVENMFLQMMYSSYLPYWLSLYLGYCDVFESKKPKSIFMPSEIDPQNLTLILASKKFGIPTAGIQQGFFSYTGPPGFLHDSTLTSNKFSYPFPSKMLVWGNIPKKILIEIGWPKNDIIPIGHVYYHHLKYIDKLLEDPPFLKFNIDSSKKIILFTTTEMQSKYLFPGYVYDTVVWKYLLENFSTKNDFIFILKPHPHEDLSEYEQILKESKSPNFFIIQGNLQELLSISDLVVSNYSTVILDALIMKKPVFELNWGDIDENMSQYSSLIEHVKIKDLTRKIMNISKNYTYDLKQWSIDTKNFFNIPLDELKIKNLLEKI